MEPIRLPLGLRIVECTITFKILPEREREIPPVQCLFQSIHVFTGGVEHAISAPDPQLASTSGWVDATADEVLSISPPADPGPSIITL